MSLDFNAFNMLCLVHPTLFIVFKCYFGPAKCRLSPLPVGVCLYVSACPGSGGRSLERGPQTYLAPVAPTATERSTFLQGVTIANTRMR